ncbi:MAG: twin-arginine translocase subunit TatC [Planctomycetaceae bacterium]|nr:twin-arginine translocase subunit TatC [Planctomycetota bacterium]NUN52234.1 twin-arginine translocase subunit TatC [Planctomycetaceae bacterium]
MSIGEHLEELRKRVFFSLIYWVAASAVAGWYADGLMGILLRPFMEALERTGQPTEFVYLQPTDSFTVMFRIVLILGAFLASPFVFWEIWGFVGAGLYGKEKRVVLLAAPISFLLFVAGAVFFYLWVLPPAVDYLYSTGRGFFPDRPDWVIVQKPNIPDAVSFFLWMALTMGIVFQLPLVMLLLNAIGIVDAGSFLKYQRHFILGATVAAAVITPSGDAVSLALFMIPILALFYLGLLAVFLRERSRRKVPS